MKGFSLLEMVLLQLPPLDGTIFYSRTVVGVIPNTDLIMARSPHLREARCIHPQSPKLIQWVR